MCTSSRESGCHPATSGKEGHASRQVWALHGRTFETARLQAAVRLGDLVERYSLRYARSDVSICQQPEELPEIIHEPTWMTDGSGDGVHKHALAPSNPDHSVNPGQGQLDASTYHYKSRRPGQAILEQRIKEICQTRVRYGYRRVQVPLRRDGWLINQKKTRHIYRELGLQLHNKNPKRRVKAKRRSDRRVAERPNKTWAMDFVHGQLATGRKICVLIVVDTFSRYAPVIDPRFSYRAEAVVQSLERICDRIGYSTTIRADQGTEFVSCDLDLWAYTKGLELDFSRPSKPTDNPFIEAFIGSFRA